jgi:voltage-dependent potassium channel beta subunit
LGPAAPQRYVHRVKGALMRYQRLGGSGLKVSVLSIGSWVTFGKQVADDEARRCLLAAYEAGVNFFDNAEAYAHGEAEVVVGRVLAELPRDKLVISSKVFWGGDGPNASGLSRKHVTEACHAALRRLQTDYLDLYFCHRPDPNTPIYETVHAMDTLIRQGKILYWGTSEWTADQLGAAYAVADAHNLVPPTMEQPQYNMFNRDRLERELAEHVAERGLGTTTWSPLASGVLTGKYDEGIPPNTRMSLPGMEWLKEYLSPDRIQRVRQLKAVAGELGCSRAQLALAWCARHPHVSTVITGASRVEQVTENMGAVDVIDRVDDTVVARIDRILSD